MLQQAPLSILVLLAVHLTSASANSFAIRSKGTGGSSQSNMTSNDNTTSSIPSVAPVFLNNGSLSSNVSFTCPGPVDGNDCPALYYCFLPSGTTGAPITTNSTNGTGNVADCSTPISILSTLGVLNVLDAAFSLLIGHNRVREKIPRLSCLGNDGDRWTLTSGFIGAILHILPITVAAGISRSHNPGMNYGSIFGLWTMRPRGTFIVFLIVRSMGWHGFSATIYDTVITEGLLDLFSLPFALTFLTGNHTNNQSSCNLQGYQASSNPVQLIHSSFGYATFAGVASAIVIVWFLVMTLNDRIWNWDPEDEQDRDSEEVGRDDNYFRRIIKRLVLEKKLIIPMIITMGSFISNWVLWGTFINVSGDSYCETGTIATGISWAVIMIIHPVLRAVFGVDF